MSEGARTRAAAEVVATLGLERHPEGGWFRRHFTHPEVDADGRERSSAIHYLLEVGDRSHWHRIDAVEVWHFHGGVPLRLSLSADGIGIRTHLLGADVVAGQTPSVVVPAGVWQSAEPEGGDPGDWSLVGCTVTPGFRFEGFELALPCWEPGLDR